MADLDACVEGGGEGRDGFEGLLASARYGVQKRMFPGQAYPWWVSRKADRTPDGLRVGSGRPG